jgi:hypothetical protein
MKIFRTDWRCSRDYAARNTLVIVRYEGCILWTRHQQLHFGSTGRYITYLISLYINVYDFDYQNHVRVMELHARIAQWL